MRCSYDFGYEVPDDFSIENLKSDIRNMFDEEEIDLENLDYGEITSRLLSDYEWSSNEISTWVDDSVISDSAADRIYEALWDRADNELYHSLKDFIIEHKSEIFEVPSRSIVMETE